MKVGVLSGIIAFVELLELWMLKQRLWNTVAREIPSNLSVCVEGPSQQVTKKN